MTDGTTVWKFLSIYTLFKLLPLANNVTNEMRNPIRTLKIAGPTALGIVFFLYFFANGTE